MMWVYLALTALVYSTEAKFYSDCGTQQAKINHVGVTDCNDSAKECILKRNSNATISIDFTPTHDVKNLETEVHGLIMNLPIPFPLPQPDACKDNGLVCPLKAGDKVFYNATLPVLKSYPKVKVDVKWELKNNEQDLICIIIQAKIN